jgi:hypothetical protein
MDADEGEPRRDEREAVGEPGGPEESAASAEAAPEVAEAAEAAEADPDDSGAAPEGGAVSEDRIPDEAETPLRRPRGQRRVSVPGTGPTSADEDETPAESGRRRADSSAYRERDRDRWLKEQRPPHWG